jgi:hypothetical protein
MELEEHGSGRGIRRDERNDVIDCRREIEKRAKAFITPHLVGNVRACVCRANWHVIAGSHELMPDFRKWRKGDSCMMPRSLLSANGFFWMLFPIV